MSARRLTTKDIERQFGHLTFGNLVKAHRESEEFTLKEMAKKLQLPVQVLNDIENERMIPSISKAVSLAKKLGILPELTVKLVTKKQINGKL